jgi:hypothetical protein
MTLSEANLVCTNDARRNDVRRPSQVAKTRYTRTGNCGCRQLGLTPALHVGWETAAVTQTKGRGRPLGGFRASSRRSHETSLERSFDLSFQRSFDASFRRSFEVSDERSNTLSFETSDARSDVASFEMSDERSYEVSFRVSFPMSDPRYSAASFPGSLQRDFRLPIVVWRLSGETPPIASLRRGDTPTISVGLGGPCPTVHPRSSVVNPYAYGKRAGGRTARYWSVPGVQAGLLDVRGQLGSERSQVTNQFLGCRGVNRVDGHVVAPAGHVTGYPPLPDLGPRRR